MRNGYNVCVKAMQSSYAKQLCKIAMRNSYETPLCENDLHNYTIEVLQCSIGMLISTTLVHVYI